VQCRERPRDTDWAGTETAMLKKTLVWLMLIKRFVSITASSFQYGQVAELKQSKIFEKELAVHVEQG
jgi:hypothetical protein